MLLRHTTKYTILHSTFEMVDYKMAYATKLVGLIVIIQKLMEICQVSLNRNYKEYLRVNHISLRVDILI